MSNGDSGIEKAEWKDAAERIFMDLVFWRLAGGGWMGDPAAWD